MYLSRYLITTYVFILSDNYISCNYYNIYYIMKLEEYQKLIELQILTQSGLQNILEANKAYQNNEINKDFNNAKLFKPITDSNKELIDRIEKKTDQSDELIKQITQALPLYNQQIQQVQQEPLTYDGNENNDKEKSSKETKDDPPRKLGVMNIFNNEEYKFIDDLMNNKKVYLYTRKKDNVDIFTDIKLLDLNDLKKYTKDQLRDYLKSEELDKFTKQLSGAKRYHDGFDMKIDALGKYKEAIMAYIDSHKFVQIDDKPTDKDDKPADKPDDKPADKPDDKPADKPDDKPADKADDKTDDKVENKITEIEGEGIKKRRNGYKIENTKYGEKIKINMDKLFNNYYVEAWYGDNILYENQGDKDTVELLTKGRIDKKKKYSNLSKQIFNDMMILSGMIKKRNGKNKLLGESNIILNENDLKKRIALIRGSIIAGNDNKKLQHELSRLTNQENVTQNKTIDSLFNELKSMTPLLKTSEGDENVHNQVYNIIDYLRTNRHISRDQYHKYIKKHLM